MSATGTIEALIASFLKAIIIPYEALLNLLWHYTLNFGMSPGHAFLSIYFQNTSYLSLLNNASHISLYMVTPVVAVAALYFLAMNNIRPDRSAMSSLYRSAIISISALACIFIWIEAFSEAGSLYSYLWSHSSISSDSVLPVSSGLFSGSLSGAGTTTSIMEFLMITAYFGAVVILLTTLAIRQALLLLLLPLLPIFTMLSMVGYFQKYSKVMWEIFIEFSMFPFLALLSLSLAENFRNYVPLQLAFLALPALLPGYLFFSGRGPSHTPFLNLFGSMAAGSFVSTVAGYSMAFSEMGSGDFMRGFSRFIQLPSSNSTSTKPSINRAVPRDVYAEAANEELKFRRNPD